MSNPFAGQTYTEDYKLFNNLGLPLFSDVEGIDEFFVGRVVANDGEVKIWVKCLPAQFWRFEININDLDKTIECKTGSGSLSDFWPTVELLLRDMFIITSVKKS